LAQNVEQTVKKQIPITDFQLIGILMMTTAGSYIMKLHETTQNDYLSYNANNQLIYIGIVSLCFILIS